MPAGHEDLQLDEPADDTWGLAHELQLDDAEEPVVGRNVPAAQ